MQDEDFLELLGPDAQLLNIGAAAVALVLLILIVRFVYQAVGLR